MTSPRPAGTVARTARTLLVLTSAAVCIGLASVAWAAGEATGTLSIQSVETTAYPEVGLRVMLPPEMLAAGELKASDFQLHENGIPVEITGAKPLTGKREPVKVALVVDVSGSMKGQPIADAKRAATGFVQAMGDQDRLALLTIGDPSRIVHGFTGDKAALANSVSPLEAGGETALYDAIVSAAGLLGIEGGSNRVIVLLSDGGDTVSGSSLTAAADALAGAGVTLHAVTLVTPEFNQAALESLARNSGGSVLPVKDSGQLQSMFADLARQLMSPYLVTYTSEGPATKQIELDLVVSSRDARSSASAVFPNPAFSIAPGATQAPASLPGAGWPVAIAITVFVAVGLLSAGVLLLVRPEPNTLRQLKYYERMGSSGAGGSADPGVWDESSVQARVMRLADTVATKGGVSGAVRTELERAGLPLRVTEYMVLHVLIVVAGGFIVQLLGGRLLVTFAAVFVLALGPVLVLRYLGTKRTEAFQAQLPDVLNLISGSLRAGWGLLQAVGIVVEEIGAPAGPEFGRVVNEARLGLPLEDAFAKMAERLGSEDFRWAVTAIGIQREVGGNLAEVLDIVAGAVRERAALQRQIRSLTAEGRISAVVLIGLPFVEGLALSVINPGYLSVLTSSSAGLASMAFAILLLLVGAIWLKNIVTIEV